MDTDINLDLDEPVIEQPLDEDDRYLLDDEVDEDEAKRKAEEAEEERLQALVDRKIADRFMREPEPKPTPRYVEPPAPTPTANLTEDQLISKMAEEITNDLALNPQEAVRKVLQATRAMSNQSAETATERANRVTIEQYRASRRDDPMFKAISEDFDAEVDSYTPSQLAKSTPAQVRKALEAAEDQALGRYYKKQLAEKRNRSVEPPRYSGGRTGGGSNTVPSRLTAEEKTLVRIAKSSGLSDKDIKELVRENRK